MENKKIKLTKKMLSPYLSDVGLSKTLDKIQYPKEMLEDCFSENGKEIIKDCNTDNLLIILNSISIFIDDILKEYMNMQKIDNDMFDDIKTMFAKTNDIFENVLTPFGVSFCHHLITRNALSEVMKTYYEESKKLG